MVACCYMPVLQFEFVTGGSGIGGLSIDVSGSGGPNKPTLKQDTRFAEWAVKRARHRAKQSKDVEFEAWWVALSTPFKLRCNIVQKLARSQVNKGVGTVTYNVQRFLGVVSEVRDAIIFDPFRCVFGP